MQQPTTPQRKPLSEVAVNEGQRLANDPNVVAIGYGLKFVKGRPTLEAALQYYVCAKVSNDDEIRKLGTYKVPTDVEGYRTDVIQLVIDRKTACPGDNSPTGTRGGDKEDPLVGGTSTTILGNFHSFPTGYGTLGGICFDTTTGDAMALSNAHVYGSDIGNEGIQPWLPTSEYFEAAVKYLFCGGPLAHLFFWTAPSDLTVLLTTAAAAAWTAAIASDAEDPSRWGQRTGTVPAPGAQTEREQIRIKAEVPHLPFPGRDWTTKSHWDYTRHTTAGSSSASIDEARPNEHVLVGKRVFSDRDLYFPGDRVRICADLWTPPSRVAPTEHFVVAHCFPLADPSRSVRRVLVPGVLCSRVDRELDHQRNPVCVDKFQPQVEGVAQMNFPVVAPPFRMWSEAASTTLRDSALLIPQSTPIHIVCPPSTHVALKVFHFNRRIRVRAFSANGREIDKAESTDEQGIVQTLSLTGPEIVAVLVEGGGGEGFLSGICVDKRIIPAEKWKAKSTYYSGTLDLALQEPAGKWGVIVIAQTLDNTPTGGDPVTAARRLSGIVDTANIVETGECACTALFDHVFEVRELPPGPIIR